MTSLLRLARRPAILLLLLTMAAVAIHGYHIGVEDQDVYLAAVYKNLDPQLYPVNSVFFTEQMRSSLFIPIIAGSIRLTHLPVPWAIFLWQIAAIYLVLLGCWKLAVYCFDNDYARWSGVLMVTALFSMPIAGTALLPMDNYLHPRALAAAAILLALSAALQRRWIVVVLWLVAAAAMHPLMALFGVSLIFFVTVPLPSRWPGAAVVGAFAIMPLGLFKQPSDAWNEAAQARSYYFPLQWTWYEWLGLIAPILLVLWYWRIARRRQMRRLEFITLRISAFAIFQFAVAALMTMPAATRQLSSLQPMRFLHIYYFLFLLISGGLLGEFLFNDKAWRWIVFYLPLVAAMFYVQRDLYASSGQIDWPCRRPSNPWAQAFIWAEQNTPRDAVFATDPRYMDLHGEEDYGFRALARRSLLAENQKDPGAATVFPALAEPWREQVHAQQGIEHFNRAQFRQLNQLYGVTWVVLPAAETPLACPYRNEVAQVCKVD